MVWDCIEDTLHHDFDRLPNDNTMVLGWEQVPSDMASQIQGGLPGTEHEQGIWGDCWGNVNIVFRAYRYSPDFSGFRGKSFSPDTYAWLSHLFARS